MKLRRLYVMSGIAKGAGPKGQDHWGRAKGAGPFGQDQRGRAKGAGPKGQGQRGRAKEAFNTKGAGSQDLKLCSDVPTVNFIGTWTFITVSRHLGPSI